MRDRLGKLVKNTGQLMKEALDMADFALKKGHIRATDTKIKERLEICKKCDKFDGSRCNLCGCFMKYKVVLASSVCPIGKWG